MSGSADEITNFNQYNQLRIIPHRNDPCLIRGGDGDFSSFRNNWLVALKLKWFMKNTSKPKGD